MLTDPSRIFLRMSALALPLAILYAALGNDRTGVGLLMALFFVAVIGAVSVLRGRHTEALVADGDDGAAAARAGGEPHALVPVRPSAAPPIAAAAVALLAASLVLGGAAVVAAIALGLMALVWWASLGLGERRGEPVNLLPVAIPVVMLLVIASVVFFMSRVLLALPSKMVSTFLALIVAVLILGVGSAIAARPSIAPSRLVALLAAVGVVLVGAGVAAAAVGERRVEKHEEPGGAPVAVTAKGTAFLEKNIKLVAGKPGVIKFDNKDSAIPHNVAVYDSSELQKLLFKGDIVVGPISTEYKVPALEAGTYFFHCDVHPNMTGSVKVT